MSENTEKRIKLLILWDILQRETDEHNRMSSHQLLRRLKEKGIECERRTLYHDIELLSEFGYTVYCMRKKCNEYYVKERTFDAAELELVADAIQAMRFISPKTSLALIEKFARLGGEQGFRLLERTSIRFNTAKCANENVFSTIQTILLCLKQQTKMQFFYFDLNEDKEKIYRHNHWIYIVEPLGLIFNEDNYYLICTDNRHGGIVSHYRVDRIDGQECLAEPISEKNKRLRKKLDGYTQKIFKMYTGEEHDVTLEFDKDAMGAVYDKFGTDIRITCKKNRFRVKVRIQTSPTFYGWVFQFGPKMEIVFPPKIIDEYREQLDLTLRAVLRRKNSEETEDEP